MVKLAIASQPSFAISDVEMRRPGKSYTIDTIRTLLDQYGGGTELFFIIGIDAFLEFPTWRSPDELLRLCHFVVVSRPGSTFTPLVHMPPLASLIAGANLHERIETLGLLNAHRLARLDIPIPEGKRIVLLALEPCDVSASEIRANVKQGRSAANLLPPLVESYILKHHLYS